MWCYVSNFWGLLWLLSVWCSCCPVLELNGEQGGTTERSRLLELMKESDSPHLTSKRSLESHLLDALRPLDQQLQRGSVHGDSLSTDFVEEHQSLRSPGSRGGHHGGGTHPFHGGDLERVPQALGEREMEEVVHELNSLQGEKRYATYPHAEYLFWLRSGECPQREEGVSEFFCPSPDEATGRWSCIADGQLCDQMRDCPNGEDEQPVNCLFFHVIQAHVTKLAQSLLWAARAREI